MWIRTGAVTSSCDTVQQSFTLKHDAVWFVGTKQAPGERTTMSDLHSPDGFVKRVVELEAEAILLGGSLDQLACAEQDCAHPVVCFGGLIDQKNPGLKGTPQLGPTLQRATDLQGDSTYICEQILLLCKVLYANNSDRAELRTWTEWILIVAVFAVDASSQHLQPVGHDDNAGVLQGTKQFFGCPFLLLPVILLLDLWKKTKKN